MKQLTCPYCNYGIECKSIGTIYYEVMVDKNGEINFLTPKHKHKDNRREVYFCDECKEEFTLNEIEDMANKSNDIKE